MIRFRTFFIIMALLTLLFLMAPIVLGLISAILTYHGTCYGFTDGSGPCPWQEYASAQVFWSSLLDIPISMYIIPCWLVAVGVWLYKRRSSDPDTIPLSLVILIPLVGCLGGGCLISILPVFIRLFNGF